MKTKFYILYLILLLSITVKAQNNINVVFNETSLNNAIKVIKDARALNFGDYKDKYGLNAWFVNFNGAQVDIQPNNTVVINNVIFSGGVDLDLWAFALKPTGNITGTITGQFNVKGNPNDGYFLYVVPMAVNLAYSGSLQAVGNLVTFLINNFYSLLPEIKMNLGTSLLPDPMLNYFASGIPQITTNNSEVILTFEVLFDDLFIKNKTIQSGEVVHYTASNSITFGHGFSVESGATFSASIKPRGRGDFTEMELSNTRDRGIVIYNVGDTVISSKELIINLDSLDLSVEKEITTRGQSTTLSNDKNNDVFQTKYPQVNVFPNPFMNTLTINTPDPLIQFSITIIDMQGRIVYERRNISQSEIDLSGLAEGMYVLRFSSEIINETKKIIKIE